MSIQPVAQTASRADLEKALDEALTDDLLAKLQKKVSDAVAEATDLFEYNLKSDTSYNLGLHVEYQTRYAIEAMLNGDEEQFKRYIGASGYTGRTGDHTIIHGKLFETGSIALRRKLVDAYPELLKSQRILDLEDQVASLVQQNAKLERRATEMYERSL